ncbi:hypothetical protein, partial [Staphylococcus haemolyticus]|uniref:hypothetical protein n=1 Tax=Staphylococcus haemolyticus TaxID=1283 RepID=UPI003C6FDAED
DNFYIISIEIVFFSLIQELYVPDSFFHLSKNFMSRTLFFTYPRTLCPGLLTNYLLEDINCDLMRSALFE